MANCYAFHFFYPSTPLKFRNMESVYRHHVNFTFLVPLTFLPVNFCACVDITIFFIGIVQVWMDILRISLVTLRKSILEMKTYIVGLPACFSLSLSFLV